MFKNARKNGLYTLLVLGAFSFQMHFAHAADYFPKKAVLSNVGTLPLEVRAVDLTQSGHLDLVVDNQDSNITLFLNDGHGNFTQATSSPLAWGTSKGGLMEIADFNKDGKPDIVLNDTAANKATILINNGNNSFSVGSVISNINNSYSPVVADFNKDENPDLVMVEGDFNNNTIYLFLGNGTADYSSITPVQIKVGKNPNAAVAANFDEDENLDLAILNGVDGTISVLKGDSKGGLVDFSGSPFLINSMDGRGSLFTGDLNHDGKADLVLGGFDYQGMGVWYGREDGTFTEAPESPYMVTVGDKPDGAHSIAGVDLRGTGLLDLLIVGGNLNDLHIFLANTDGNYTEATSSPISLNSDIHSANLITVADLDGDGKPDVAVPNIRSNSITLLFANHAPTLSTPVADTTAGTFKITYTDADGELPDTTTGGRIGIKIDGTEIPMAEADAKETDATQGKIYQVTKTDLSVGDHKYQFYANDGTYDALGNPATENILAEKVLTIPAPDSGDSGGGGGGGCSIQMNASSSLFSLIFLSALYTFSFGLLRRRAKGWL